MPARIHIRNFPKIYHPKKNKFEFCIGYNRVSCIQQHCCIFGGVFMTLLGLFFIMPALKCVTFGVFSLNSQVTLNISSHFRNGADCHQLLLFVRYVRNMVILWTYSMFNSDDTSILLISFVMTTPEITMMIAKKRLVKCHENIVEHSKKCT